MQIESLTIYLSRTITESYRNKCEDMYQLAKFPRSNDIACMSNNVLLEEEKRTETNFLQLKRLNIPDALSEKQIISQMNTWYELHYSEYNNTILDYELKLKTIADKFHKELDTKKEELQRAYSSSLLEHKNKLNCYLPIYLIQENKRAIELFASEYRIDLTYYTIDFYSMTLQEIIDITQLAASSIHETIQGTKGFSSLLKLLYLPLYWQPFAEKGNNALLKGFYLLLLIVLIYAGKPWSLGSISSLVIVLTVGNLCFSLKNRKLLSVAYTLQNCFEQFDDRITELLEEEPNLTELLKRYKELENADWSEQIVGLQSVVNEQLNFFIQKSPEADLKNQLAVESSSTCIDKYVKAMDRIRENYLSLLKKELLLYKEYCDCISKEIDVRANTATGPGIPVNSNYHMNFSFKSSIAQAANGRIVGYDSTTVPFKNILFLYHNEEERCDRINIMKLILASMLGNVRENFLELIIVDTERLGRELTEFLNKGIRNIVKLVTDEWEKTFKGIVDDAKQNMISVGMDDFNKYNEKNGAAGKVTLEYKIIIILSTDKDLWTNKIFQEFKNYSTEMGVWVWLVHQGKSLFSGSDKVPEGFYKMLEFPVVIDKPEVFSFQKSLYPLCQSGKYLKPLRYDIDIGKKSVQAMMETMENGRITIVDYEKEYRLKHIPDNKIWSYSTLDGIELHFGFLDGDRSNPHMEWLGSDGAKPVHCLMAGETGAGKSATINQILANLLYMYPPEQLELIMIDFKNVEFNMYTGNLLIPHAKLIAGTTDGEYALSIFEYLLSEMRHRQSEFAKYKFQSITDWNKAVLNKDIDESYMPRILLLVDEFQVMFTEVDDKIVDKIKLLITSVSKLARFAGCHLWFTSQSMKGTMSQDILDQFALRAALRSSYDTSLDILGNDAAFKKLRGRGFIYTNCSKGDSEENHRYTIPFISNQYIKEYLPKLIKKCSIENHLHRQADFYDEKTNHSLNELSRWYETEAVQEDNAIFLGAKTFYSTNVLPVNFIMNREDGEHLIIAGLNRDDRYNIANTILTQLEYYQYEIIASCPDQEFARLLDLEKRIPKEYQSMLYNNSANELFQLLEYVIEIRSSAPNKRWSPIYVLNFLWDKMIGIGDDYKIVERYQELLQKAAALDIHFVVVTRLAKSFSAFLPYINHKICAQADEDTSYKLLDSQKATKLSQDCNTARMAIYIKGIKEEKFKIYQSHIDKRKLRKEVACIFQ